jgi:hypothetical protein
MVAWLTAYDTDLKRRVRLGGATGALDDPEVRRIIHAYYEIHAL